MNKGLTNGAVSQDAQASEIQTRWLGVTRVVESGAEDDSSPGSSRDSNIDTNSNDAITFRASIETEDRAGDVIKADGWELDNYRRNPVVLWAHRHDLLPIGKSVDIWVENGALFATIEFAATEFAQQIKQLFESGFLRGVSVGFRALKTTPGANTNRRGTTFEKQELLEISAAPVPMHPGALSLDAERTNVDDREQRELLPLFRQLTEIWQSIAAISN